MMFKKVSVIFTIIAFSSCAAPNSGNSGGEENDRLQVDPLALSNIRQLTFAGKRTGEGYFNNMGTLMVFQSEREKDNPFYQIYTLDLNTGDCERVSPGYGKTTCGYFYPDTKRLIFASTHLDKNAVKKQEDEMKERSLVEKRRYNWDFDGQYDIYEADINGGSVRNLTNILGYDAEGSISPDGKRIVFASNRHAYSRELSDDDNSKLKNNAAAFVDIYIMSSDGTNVRQLTYEDGYDGGPFFSPDGKKIVWRHFSVDGHKAEIFEMDINGGSKKQITTFGVMSWAPYYHPSGDYIVFSANKEGFGNFELYVVDSAGINDPVRLTFSDGFDGLPAFSPDGKRISWTSNRRSNESQIFIADWNDSKIRILLKLEQKVYAKPEEERKGPVLTPELRGNTGATISDISSVDIYTHISKLASPEMEGRYTGSDGEKKARNYVVSVFESIGLEPSGDGNSYLQKFEFTDRESNTKVESFNIVAALRSTSSETKSCVVIGAHLDHLGVGKREGSLALNIEGEVVHYGADDNASGVSAVLEIAQSLADMKSKGLFSGVHDILFCIWSGEEIGLLGSGHFMRSHGNRQIIAYLNLDMVGRFTESLFVQGVGSSSVWPRLIEENSILSGLPVVVQKDCYLPTDTTSFYLNGIPILNFFTGAHSDYHTNTDTADKINYDAEEKISRFALRLLSDISQEKTVPDYIETQPPKRSLSHGKSRIYLGTIPDYSQEVEGVVFAGVVKGGPAENAGITKGDRIIELDNKQIKNIYDYTDAIRSLKADCPVKAVVIRNGKRVELTVTPRLKNE
ncbi:MAG: M28 family peptidase [Planctomycetes bacterium]|nr:M28 family peptidase [Planctomycetota bacterium]